MNKETTAASGTLTFNTDGAAAMLDNLIKEVPPANYTAEEANNIDMPRNRIANRRYTDESFATYCVRRKEQAKIIKKRLKGILVWNSIEQGPYSRG